ncbi:MAG: hypothetical protein U0J65_01310 [Christensenellales bacterium]|nr:hypothetical protein [Christensenellales bacterium]
MQGILIRIVNWMADALLARLERPMDDIRVRLDGLERLHEQDRAALECDLSVMDDRICDLIGICSRRGYTTANERRRITRMHDAYRARGGNHGEEIEYEAFLQLPGEEEYARGIREKGEVR